MIIIKQQGRLGNQLFQYAFAKKLQTEFYNDENIYINSNSVISSGEKSDGWENSLKYFNLDEYYVTDTYEINVLQKIILYFYLAIRKMVREIFKLGLDTKKMDVFFSSILNYFGIYCINSGYFEPKRSKFKNKILVGCFESSKFFDDIRDDIIREFQPTSGPKFENNDLYKVIEQSNTVCITIRRGDFLSSKFSKSHYICTNEYFYKAEKIIKEKVKNPVFIVFSDDVEWVKQNMHFEGEVYYETGNDPIWEKLRLMSSCKHFIISNSTFSWWAQYLSTNDNKVVIAPSKWNNKIRNKDIYQDYWTQIDV